MKYKSITEKDSRQEFMVRFLQEQTARHDEESLRFILDNPQGRWFLMRLLDASNVNGPCFTGNSHTFYNEGKREMGLQLMRSITALGMDGIKLRQMAELEYAEYQIKMRNLAEEQMKEEEANDYRS